MSSKYFAWSVPIHERSIEFVYSKSEDSQDAGSSPPDDGGNSSVRAQSQDTDPNTEQKQIELLRGATVARRTALAFSLSDTVIGLARRAIQLANPELGPQDVLLRFIALHYGPALAESLQADLHRRSQ